MTQRNKTVHVSPSSLRLGRTDWRMGDKLSERHASLGHRRWAATTHPKPYPMSCTPQSSKLLELTARHGIVGFAALESLCFSFTLGLRPCHDVHKLVSTPSVVVPSDDAALRTMIGKSLQVCWVFDVELAQASTYIGSKLATMFVQCKGAGVESRELPLHALVRSRRHHL